MRPALGRIRSSISPDRRGLPAPFGPRYPKTSPSSRLEGEIRDAAMRSVVLRQAIDSDGDGHCRKAMRRVGPGSRLEAETDAAALRAVAAPIGKGGRSRSGSTRLAYGGNGVGRLDGFVVFVRGGLPGDLVAPARRR